MPELPEIVTLARQMDHEFRGRIIAAVQVRQPKCLNVPPAEFERLLAGKRIASVTSRGKWVFTLLKPETHFLLNLGMGGEARYHARQGNLFRRSGKSRSTFSDESSLSVGFWWFGYAHVVTELASHQMTAPLGLNPLDDEDFTYARFAALLFGRKGAIKPVLMDQTKIAGIGNVYIQDILFRAGLHPSRLMPSINEAERRLLFEAISENLRAATELGGLEYERDLYGQPGRFNEFLVGYREGEPCPNCGTTVEKIKTGSTASYICPQCQR